jgi:hypothetical protein
MDTPNSQAHLNYFNAETAAPVPEIKPNTACSNCNHWRQSSNPYFLQNGSCTIKNMRQTKSYSTCGYHNKEVVK